MKGGKPLRQESKTGAQITPELQNIPFHTKATASDFPRHPLFTPRHFQVERENLSIDLGFPGIRQSRARAALTG